MNGALRPVMDGIFDQGPPPQLLGGHCPECERKYFPKPTVCPRCLGPLHQVALSSTGRLYSFSTVRTRAPFDLPQPYAVGYVDLDDDSLRIVSLLDPERVDDLAIGQPLALRVAPIGVTPGGEPCLRYYFTPQDGGNP